jgi:hypothetical protein
MKDLLIQYLVPILVCAGWYLLAGLIGSILGKFTSIESWVVSNPKRALAYQLLRAVGLDFKKILGSLKAYAEARSGFPPVIEVKASTEIVPELGPVETVITKRVALKNIAAAPTPTTPTVDVKSAIATAIAKGETK